MVRNAHNGGLIVLAACIAGTLAAGTESGAVSAQASSIRCTSPAASQVTAAVDIYTIDAPNAHTVEPSHVPDSAQAHVYYQTYSSWKSDVRDGRQDLPLDAVYGDGCVDVVKGRALLPLRSSGSERDGAEYMLTLVMDHDGEQVAARWTLEVHPLHPKQGSRSDLVDFQMVMVYPTLTHWSDDETSRDHRTARDVQSYALQVSPEPRSLVLNSSFNPPVHNNRTPIVLVHGIHGNAGYFGGLPFELKDRGLDVWEFYYPNDQNIRFSAGLFGQAVRMIGRLYDRPAVDVVAHSMGGLVTRAYIQGFGLLASDESDIAPGDRAVPYRGEVRKWVSLGTPHYGHLWSRALTGGTIDSDCRNRTAVIQLLDKLHPDGIPFADGEPALLQLATGSALLWRLNEGPLPTGIDTIRDWLTVTAHPPSFETLDKLTVGCLAFDPLNDNVVDGVAGHLSSFAVPSYEIELSRPGPFSTIHEVLARDSAQLPATLASFVGGANLGSRQSPRIGVPQRVLILDSPLQGSFPVDIAGLDVRFVDSPSPADGALIGDGTIGLTTANTVLTLNDNVGVRTVVQGYPIASVLTRWDPGDATPDGASAHRFPGIMRDAEFGLDTTIPGGGYVALEPDTYRQLAVCQDKRALALTSADALQIEAAADDAIRISWHTNRPAWATVRYAGRDGAPNDLAVPDETADGLVVLPDQVAGDTVNVHVVLRDPCQGAPVEVTRDVRLTSPGGGIPGQGAGSSTVLVLDASQSMDTLDANARGDSRWLAAVDASQRLLHMIGRENQAFGAVHQIGAVAFSNEATVLSPLLSDTDAVLAGLQSRGPVGGTYMAAGIETAITMLGSSTGRRIAVVLSDGEAQDQDLVRAMLPDLGAAADCIYVVGFGGSGLGGLFGIPMFGSGIDESFLQEVAATTSCGAYYPAANADELAHAYVKLRHEATGSLVSDTTGMIAPGETTAAQPFDVPSRAGELHVTLDWPGSALDLLLTDPAGRQVGPGYPGATIDLAGPPVYAIVQQPMAGRWSMQAFGRDLPSGAEAYSLVASTRGDGLPEVLPQPASNTGTLALFAVLLTGGVLFATRPRNAGGRGGARGEPIQRRARAANPPGLRPAWPLVFTVNGLGPTPFLSAVNGGSWRVGRDGSSDLVLDNPSVSRLHCTVLLDAAGSWHVRNESRTAGTRVNGQSVEHAPLRPGDVVQLGRVRLEVVDPKRVNPSAGGGRSAAHPEVRAS